MLIKNEEVFTKFAVKLATEAGKIAKKYFRSNSSTKIKSDKSLVTKADIEIEKKLIKLIKTEFPNHAILGEEFGSNNKKSEYKWIIDPIDGTSAFAAGKPSFGILISLLKNNSPIIGIIFQPITNEIWISDNKKTSLNGKRIKTSLNKNLSTASLATTSKDLFAGKDFIVFEKVQGKIRNTLYGGDCYLYGLLAAGFIDIVMESNLKPYDYAALVPVVEAAGGIITDWQGKPLNFKNESNVLAAGNKFLHNEILKIISEN